MKKYGVLVVDDSALMRKTICAYIEASPHLYISGRARNGIDAMEKVKRLKPDLVTLDIEMPEMNGWDTLQALNVLHLTPVIVISDMHDEQQSMESGAANFIAKNKLSQLENDSLLEEFHTKLVEACNKFSIPVPISEILPEPSPQQPQIKNLPIELLIIGSSTGGPSALQQILSRFLTDLPIPVFVIQHMPVGFTKSLATRFNNKCQLIVKEAEHHEILKAGTVYIAPAGVQSNLLKLPNGEYQVTQYEDNEEYSLYKPSIDVTLLSIAKSAKHKLLTVILTGMGDDGLKGCYAVKEHGGKVLAEAEETCVVYGMPKVVMDAGLVDKQLPIHMLFDEITTQISE